MPGAGIPVRGKKSSAAGDQYTDYVNAEKQQQCLAVAVAGGDAPYGITLLLIAEAALHEDRKSVV